MCPTVLVRIEQLLRAQEIAYDILHHPPVKTSAEAAAMAHSATSGGMDKMNSEIGSMARSAVTKIDPNMASMPKLIESTRKALAEHFKD